MVFDINVAISWILFLALFPISFFWLRRAWRIIFKQDFSEVGLRKGEPPENPKKFAPYAAAINLIGGGIVVGVILGVVSGEMEYQTWSAIAGSTIWMKFIFDFILSRHAHPIVPAKKKPDTESGPKP
ncbi:MAG: hypothetical protein K9J42_11595 [Sulfuritalea sp.]|nr:hypothetical protein [Sulfuritalea sp.]